MTEAEHLEGPLLTHRGVVYPWELDHMGHMNVTFYTAKFDEATWHFFAAVGLTAEVMKAGHCGMAAVRQEITYRRELFAGDLIRVETDVLEVGRSSLTFRHAMTEEVTGELACTSVVTAVHIDTDSRSARPLEERVASRAGRLVLAEGGGPGSASG